MAQSDLKAKAGEVLELVDAELPVHLLQTEIERALIAAFIAGEEKMRERAAEKVFASPDLKDHELTPYGFDRKQLKAEILALPLSNAMQTDKE
jgi:hypothetical protein